jgi:enterochelin esterase-like enzyme
MLGSHVLPDGKIRFMYHDNSAEEIGVAGNFNSWQAVALAHQGNGWWGADLGPLSDGNVFYKFVTPRGWVTDQFNYRRTSGGENSFLNVGGKCGHLLRRGFHSDSLGKSKNYIIYLPPAYAHNPWRSFPVLYLMGGLFESETGWVDRAGVDSLLDELTVSGQIDDMIVVMPDKDDAVFHEEAWGAYTGFLARDLPMHIEAEYRTLPVRGSEGLSLGAGWAIRMGLMFPEQFCSVSALSGHFTEDFFRSAKGNVARVQGAGVRFRIACGNGEGPVIENNGDFGRFLEGLGLYCEFHVNAGPHEWPLWSQQIGHSFRFHDYGFKSRVG